MKDLISIIVPCYNEQEALPFFVDEVKRVTDSMKEQCNFEIIFIDDGSKDQTLKFVKSSETLGTMKKYISFSRNFGKEAAMLAGLSYSKGDFVAVMDADMQDPPSLLPKMYESLKTEDYDSVATRRVTRTGEPVIRSFFAKMFYRIINRISDADIVDGARDYRLMKRQMVDAILSMQEYNRFSKGIFGWVGFKTKWLPYENVDRIAGNTKWSFFKLFFYSIDGITAFSTVPLAISSFLGVFLCFLAVIAIITIVVKTVLFGDPVGGWPSMMCVILLLGGLQFLCIGILGQYMSRMYLETKHRPVFIVKEDNFDK